MTDRGGDESGSRDTFGRLFTLAEARALLPRVGALLSEVRRQRQVAREAQAALDLLTPAMRQNGSAPKAAALEMAIRRAARAIARGVQGIMQLGVVIKDLDHGIVDFPSRRDDRVIYLCWRLGEPTITHWHEIDDGFQGRQPL